ncbi:MAG: hypothetical protein JSS51_04045 [Planctomycetes bacterium]|nr:hypothetical protein [Planctomycetota bacterium]
MTKIEKVAPFPAWVLWEARGPTKEHWGYAPELDVLRDFKASGCYAIIDAKTKKVLYVGESHTGRLYDTITRHFRSWKRDPASSEGRRRGGTTYDRTRVLVSYTITPASEAQDRQYEEIQRLNPRDNTVDGSTVVEPPF